MFLDSLPIAFIGLAGGWGFMFYVYARGDWKAWPDLVEVDVRNHIWKRTRWYPEKNAWASAIMASSLTFLALLFFTLGK